MRRFVTFPCSEFDKSRILSVLPGTGGGKGKYLREIVAETGISREEVKRCLRSLKREEKVYCTHNLWRQTKVSPSKILRKLRSF